MNSVSQIYLMSVLRDLECCCIQAGLPFKHTHAEITERAMQCSHILDRNEKLISSSPRKSISIFTHLKGSLKAQVIDYFNLNEFNSICKEWAAYTGKEPLYELLGKAEKQLSLLAMPFENGDISVYEHSRISATIECCLDGISVDTNSPCCLLFSIDLSGIQNFLYTIGNKGALKGLKARSFYLGMLMTHVADSILEKCGYSRLNLIYCGGGKAHLLMANTQHNLNTANALISQANQFLQKHFGTALYLAAGYTEASLNDLTSADGNTPCFAELFQKTSAMISQKKLRRYTASELQFFNNNEEDNERECAICGNGSKLKERDGIFVCDDCLRFENFAAVLKYAPAGFVITGSPGDVYLELPFDKYICPDKTVLSAERLYCINTEYADKGFPLYLGNYQPDSEEPITFEMLANFSCGIQRLGIVRMDVDNLGCMFANGFFDPSSDKPYHLVSLVRYSALSLAITRFFQYDINHIVANEPPSHSLTSLTNRGRALSIVYSGGDDLFIAGAWNEVADAAMAIQEAFSRYTFGKASISGGIGLYGITEPINILAAQCAGLEDAAKQMPGKAAISVFDREYCFSWIDYSNTLLEVMLPAVEKLCKREVHGNTFLYHIMELLKDISTNPIAIARLAYLLARHCPSEDTGKVYTDVTRQIYAWALDQKHNKMLQCAILLYVYLYREEKEE